MRAENGQSNQKFGAITILNSGDKVATLSRHRARATFHSTHRNLFEILLNQPEIRLYLPFSDWIKTKRTSVSIQINRKMVNTIWFRVDLIRFQKVSSVCNEPWQNKRYSPIISTICGPNKVLPVSNGQNFFLTKHGKNTASVECHRKVMWIFSNVFVRYWRSIKIILDIKYSIQFLNSWNYYILSKNIISKSSISSFQFQFAGKSQSKWCRRSKSKSRLI